MLNQQDDNHLFFVHLKAELRRNIGLLQAEVQKKDGMLQFPPIFNCFEYVVSDGLHCSVKIRDLDC